MVSSSSLVPEESDSFVSARDDLFAVADLADFDDLVEVRSGADPELEMYVEALEILEAEGIPYRLVVPT